MAPFFDFGAYKTGPPITGSPVVYRLDEMLHSKVYAITLPMRPTNLMKDRPEAASAETAFNTVSNHLILPMIYCFDFQGEAMRQVCASQTNIQCIDFDEVKRQLWEDK